MIRFYSIDHPSRVAEVRRGAMALASEEGLDNTLASKLALIVTEACTNLLKHATGGEICLSPLPESSGPGAEVLAVDRGPGMADVTRCLADGFSSTQTSGTGLGALSRLSHEFDVYSEVGKGTVLVAQIRNSGRQATAIGAVVKPINGEDVSGDAWACSERNEALTIIVADGLGHGMMAARASAEAISAFRRAEDISPAAVIQQAHRALRSTRGAAVAVMQLNIASGDISFAGVGNIGGVISAAGKSQFMVSHAGTAGYGAPKIQVFSYAAPEGGLVVMHSDGLTSNWNVDDYPGLRRHHPSVIAGVLYRDANRNRDDTCVVVVKPRRST